LKIVEKRKTKTVAGVRIRNRNPIRLTTGSANGREEWSSFGRGTVVAQTCPSIMIGYQWLWLGNTQKAVAE